MATMEYYKQWIYHFSKRKSKTASSTAAAATTTTKTTTTPNQIRRADTFSSWKERFRKVSNVASILCVLDCTLLPICTILLPLLGMGFSVERAKWIHKLGHCVALFFVLPVGTLTTVLNYSTHRRTQILVIACLGLFFIYTANANNNNHNEYPPLQHLHLNEEQHDNHHHPNWSHDALHLNCGTFYHRIFNILGCTLLMGSNYLSRQFLKERHCQGPCYCSPQELQSPTTPDLNREMYNSYHYIQRIRNRGTSSSVLPLLVAPSGQYEESSSPSNIVQLPAEYYCQPISAK